MPRNNRFRFGYDLRMEAEQEAEIMIYGYITQYKWDEDDPDVTAKEFDKLLKDAKEKGATKLHLRINSGGGNVWQAVAMRAMLLNSSFDEISVDIEGLCASAATLFVCLPNVHVRIAEGSEFMIHNPSTGVWGTSADFRKALDRLTKMETDDHTMYATRTGQTEEQIKAWMDAETWFSAREAVEYGFCDELLEAGEIAACAVSPEIMETMRGMYHNIPNDVTQVTNTKPVSPTEPTAAAGDVTENNNQTEKEDPNMEINEITMDQLKTGNPALYEQIMQAGAAQERERISEIDDLTPAGYEEMAQQAKENGTDAVTFCKQIAKAQREKGKTFIAQRVEETQPAQQVKGGSAADNDGANEDEEIKQFAKEMGDMASGNVGASSDMY